LICDFVRFAAPAIIFLLLATLFRFDRVLPLSKRFPHYITESGFVQDWEKAKIWNKFVTPAKT